MSSPAKILATLCAASLLDLGPLGLPGCAQLGAIVFAQAVTLTLAAGGTVVALTNGVAVSS